MKRLLIYTYQYFWKASMLMALVMIAGSGYGQERRQEEGEVIEGQVIIDKNLKIELPPANRIFEKVPPRAPDEGSGREITYELQDYDLSLTDLPVRLRVLKLKGEKRPVYSGNYVKLGFGNYITPFLDFGLNSTSNATGYYGVSLQHISSLKGPVDKDYSADSYSSIGLYGKYTGDKALIKGRLDYDRDMVHFYGYPEGVPASKDTLKQIFNRFGLNVTFQNANAKSKFDYEIDGGFYYVKDRFTSNETGFNADFKGSYKITEGIIAGLDMNFLQAGYQYGDKVSRTLFRVTPYAVFNIGDFMMNAGANVVYITDTLNFKSSIKVYPKVKIGYMIQDRINVYAGVEGDIEDVTFNKLTNYNPYLKSGVQLAHTSKNLEVFLGVEGHILQELSFDVGLKAGNYKNLYYFVNDSLETNKFDVVYDGGNANVFNAFVSVSYIRSDIFGISGSLNYFGYGTKDIDEPWHRPSFETAVSAWYSFHKKVRLSADLFTYSGMKALDYRTTPKSVKRLDPIIDLNLKIDYMFSKRFGAFLKLDNILSKKYSYYLYYPVRGFQAMIGVTASF